MDARPDCIAHWSALEDPEPSGYDGDDEPMGFNAPVGRRLGLTRIGVHHVRLPPGERTSYPHAESAEEEFVYVITGRPVVWLDGTTHSLGPGDSVAFPSGTGVCHTFINDTDDEVALLVVGEAPKAENRVRYPMNPDHERVIDFAWRDAPPRPMGPHDGRPRRRSGA